MARKKNSRNPDEPLNLNKLFIEIFKRMPDEFLNDIGGTVKQINIRIDGNGILIDDNTHNVQIGKQEYVNAEAPVEVIKESGNFAVLKELEAVRKEQIGVVVERQAVHIKATGLVRTYSESVNLDRCVDPEGASAKYTNNVLEIKLPYSDEATMKSRVIKID